MRVVEKSKKFLVLWLNCGLVDWVPIHVRPFNLFMCTIWKHILCMPKSVLTELALYIRLKIIWCFNKKTLISIFMHHQGSSDHLTANFFTFHVCTTLWEPNPSHSLAHRYGTNSPPNLWQVTIYTSFKTYLKTYFSCTRGRFHKDLRTSPNLGLVLGDIKNLKLVLSYNVGHVTSNSSYSR